MATKEGFSPDDLEADSSNQSASAERSISTLASLGLWSISPEGFGSELTPNEVVNTNRATGEAAADTAVDNARQEVLAAFEVAQAGEIS